MVEAKGQYQIVVDEYIKRGKVRDAGDALRKMAEIDPADLKVRSQARRPLRAGRQLGTRRSRSTSPSRRAGQEGPPRGGPAGPGEGPEDRPQERQAPRRAGPGPPPPEELGARRCRSSRRRRGRPRTTPRSSCSLGEAYLGAKKIEEAGGRLPPPAPAGPAGPGRAHPDGAGLAFKGRFDEAFEPVPPRGRPVRWRGRTGRGRPALLQQIVQRSEGHIKSLVKLVEVYRRPPQGERGGRDLPAAQRGLHPRRPDGPGGLGPRDPGRDGARRTASTAASSSSCAAKSRGRRRPPASARNVVQRRHRGFFEEDFELGGAPDSRPTPPRSFGAARGSPAADRRRRRGPRRRSSSPAPERATTRSSSSEHLAEGRVFRKYGLAGEGAPTSSSRWSPASPTTWRRGRSCATSTRRRATTRRPPSSAWPWPRSAASRATARGRRSTRRRPRSSCPRRRRLRAPLAAPVRRRRPRRACGARALAPDAGSPCWSRAAAEEEISLEVEGAGPRGAGARTGAGRRAPDHLDLGARAARSRAGAPAVHRETRPRPRTDFEPTWARSPRTRSLGDELEVSGAAGRPEPAASSASRARPDARRQAPVARSRRPRPPRLEASSGSCRSPRRCLRRPPPSGAASWPRPAPRRRPREGCLPSCSGPSTRSNSTSRSASSTTQRRRWPRSSPVPGPSRARAEAGRAGPRGRGGAGAAPRARRRPARAAREACSASEAGAARRSRRAASPRPVAAASRRRAPRRRRSPEPRSTRSHSSTSRRPRSRELRRRRAVASASRSRRRHGGAPSR